MKILFLKTLTNDITTFQIEFSKRNNFYQMI